MSNWLCPLLAWLIGATALVPFFLMHLACSAAFTELSLLPQGTRYRPVLLCDRAAAYYWQLPRFWEGRLPGNWQTLKSTE